MSAHDPVGGSARPASRAARRTGVALLVAALAGALAGACTTGPDPQEFRPAISPYGITTQLSTREATYRGELLEARDTAFVVLHDSILTLVPFAGVRHATFHRYPVRYQRGTPGAEQLAELRRLARYPQGLTADQLARLLAAHGQRELRVVQR